MKKENTFCGEEEKLRRKIFGQLKYVFMWRRRKRRKYLTNENILLWRRRKTEKEYFLWRRKKTKKKNIWRNKIYLFWEEKEKGGNI